MSIVTCVVLFLVPGLSNGFDIDSTILQTTSPNPYIDPIPDTVTRYERYPGVLETTTESSLDTSTTTESITETDLQSVVQAINNAEPTPKIVTLNVPPPVNIDELTKKEEPVNVSPTSDTGSTKEADPVPRKDTPNVPPTTITVEPTPKKERPLIVPLTIDNEKPIPRTDTQNVPPTTNTDKPISGDVPEEVAKLVNAKCLEYSKYVYIDDYDQVEGSSTKRDTCHPSEPLVVGGKDAESREFPHQVALGNGNQEDPSWVCGGSLISERFVLTAAHCSNYEGHQQIKWARLGAYAIESSKGEVLNPRSVTIEIEEIIIHPGYQKDISRYDDVALLKLKDVVSFNEYIRPICLHTKYTLPKTHAMVTGWGDTKRKSWTGILQKANVTIAKKSKCKRAWSKALANESQGFDDDRMICAGNTSTDSCPDSGGPLQLPLSSPYYCMFTQIGIGSFGNECAKRVPGLYMRVSAYVPWIVSHVWPQV